MTTGDGAAERVAALAARNPPAAELARYASLAVRIDTPLLRRLRLALLPGADASAEADLWFSTLSESRGDEGLVLDAEVAALLRERLAAERLNDGSRALEAAWRHTAALHAGWPASLRLEERLTYLALAHRADAGPQIEDALQPAMVAMASGEQRAMEVARWAVRAVPRLPPAARESDAAVALALAAMAVLDGGGNAVAGASTRPMPANLGWMLPPKVFAKRARLACEVSVRGLRLRAARSEDPQDMTIELPLTRPLMLELRWTADGRPASRLHSVEPDATIALPAGWHGLQLRTLDGALYAVDPRAEDAAPASARDLLDACVQVRCGRVRARGVFVQQGWVLTTLHAVRDAQRTPSRENVEVIEVQRGSQYSHARLEVADSRIDMALLVVDLPWRGAAMPSASQGLLVGDPLMLLAEGEAPAQPILLPGTVSGLAMTMTIENRRYDNLLEVRLDYPPPPRFSDGMSGSPLLRGLEMAGVVAFRGEREIYAVPARSIDRFLAWALRTADDFPDIVLSYATDDNYKGRELDEPALERVRQALLTARLNPSMSEDAGDAPLAQAMDGAAGAACLFTPVANAGSPRARAELCALAFRRWVEPRFPVALLTYRTPLPPLPSPLLTQAHLSLDTSDDETLWQQLNERLDGEDDPPLPPPSEADFRDSALARMQSVVPGMARPATLQEAAAVLLPVLGRMDPEEARETVEFAAMLALPGGPLLDLLRAAAQSPPGRRAVYLNAMPVQYARLLLRKAWFPQDPPPHVVIRDQQWDESGEAIVGQVVDHVTAAIDCEREEVRAVMAASVLAYVIVFATRPLPPPPLVESLRRGLPGALLFFLGSEQPDLSVLGRMDIVPLPLRDDERAGLEWMQDYKRMMEAIAPRGGGDGRKGAPSSRKSA